MPEGCDVAADELHAPNRVVLCFVQTSSLTRMLLVPCKVSKESWWDARQSGGIIVEQATHFVDMMRYLGGEIDRDSIQAAVVGQDYPLSEMCDPGGELGVGTGCRIQDPWGLLGSVLQASKLHSPCFIIRMFDSGTQVKAEFCAHMSESQYSSCDRPDGCTRDTLSYAAGQRNEGGQRLSWWAGPCCSAMII